MVSFIVRNNTFCYDLPNIRDNIILSAENIKIVLSLPQENFPDKNDREWEVREWWSDSDRKAIGERKGGERVVASHTKSKQDIKHKNISI